MVLHIETEQQVSGVRELAAAGQAGSGNHLRVSLRAQAVHTQLSKLLECQVLPKTKEDFNLPHTWCVCLKHEFPWAFSVNWDIVLDSSLGFELVPDLSGE